MEMDKRPYEPDELKTANPVLSDPKAPLPATETAKKWTRHLKTAGFIGLLLIVLAGAGIRILSFEASGPVNKDILTAKDVTKTLKQAGVSLAAAAGVSPADYKMGQVQPAVYQVQALDGVLFIYDFASIGERDTVYRQWEEERRKNNSNSFDNMFTPKWQYQLAFAAKNTLLVIGLSQFPTEEYGAKITPVLLKIGKTVFYNLNGGEQAVYQGESENWQGKVKMYYYKHFWNDTQGINHYDGWSQKQPVLVFKGDPATIQGDFSYEIEYPQSKTRGTSSDGFDSRQFAERDTVVNYGGSALGLGGFTGGGGFLPQKEIVCTVTVKWNGQQETLKLNLTE
jgi:hypothetical protein